MKVVCLIPIRLNSSRIKNKNFKIIKNQTLLEYVCKRIIKSNFIDNIYIASTNKKKINTIINKYKKLKYFERSKKSSRKNSKTEEVIKEFTKKVKSDLVVLVQITNPFINNICIDQAIRKFKKKNYDTLLSVVKSKKFLWKNSNRARPINYKLNNRKMSQNLNGYFIENGSFYLFYTKNFLKHKNRLHGKIGYYEMPKKTLHEIDDYEDLKIVKKLI